jgi:hypothetical protein
VLTGDGAAELGDWLADASAAWRAWADQVAKQLAAFGVAPDGRVRSLAKDLPLNWVPEGWLAAQTGRRLVADRLVTVTERARYRRSQTEGARAEVLDIVSSGFEAQLQALREMAVSWAERERLNENAAVRAERLRSGASLRTERSA